MNFFLIVLSTTAEKNPTQTSPVTVSLCLIATIGRLKSYNTFLSPLTGFVVSQKNSPWELQKRAVVLCLHLQTSFFLPLGQAL